jgi:hypothetical protein
MPALLDQLYGLKGFGGNKKKYLFKPWNKWVECAGQHQRKRIEGGDRGVVVIVVGIRDPPGRVLKRSRIVSRGIGRMAIVRMTKKTVEMRVYEARMIVIGMRVRPGVNVRKRGHQKGCQQGQTSR